MTSGDPCALNPYNQTKKSWPRKKRSRPQKWACPSCFPYKHVQNCPANSLTKCLKSVSHKNPLPLLWESRINQSIVADMSLYCWSKSQVTFGLIKCTRSSQAYRPTLILISCIYSMAESKVWFSKLFIYTMILPEVEFPSVTGASSGFSCLLTKYISLETRVQSHHHSPQAWCVIWSRCPISIHLPCCHQIGHHSAYRDLSSIDCQGLGGIWPYRHCLQQCWTDDQWGDRVYQ